MKKVTIYFCSVIAFTLLLFSCAKDNPTTPPTNASVSLTVRMGSRPLAAQLSKVTAAGLVDSIVVSRARVLVNSIDFEGGDDDSDSDDLEFSTKPMVLMLNPMDTVTTVMVANIPFGQYEEVEIEVRKLRAFGDSLSAADSLAFADFLAGNGYSVIIEGMAFQDSIPTVFVYKAAVSAEQEYELDPPLMVSADNPVANVTLAIYTNGWFMKNGALLDPNDPANQNRIAYNIAASFEMFCDDDGDGDGDGDDDGDDGDD